MNQTEQDKKHIGVMKKYNADSCLFRAIAAGAASRLLLPILRFIQLYGHWDCSFTTVANVEWCILIKYIDPPKFRKPDKRVSLLVVCIWMFLEHFMSRTAKVIVECIVNCIVSQPGSTQWRFPTRGTHTIGSRFTELCKSVSRVVNMQKEISPNS